MCSKFNYLWSEVLYCWIDQSVVVLSHYKEKVALKHKVKSL